MLHTLTLPHPKGNVTIGWSNVAKNAAFEAYIQAKMQQGYSYVILDVPAGRQVIYNAALVIDLGVSAHSLTVLRQNMADFLTTGDISVVRLQGDDNQIRHVRVATSAREVLAHDTVEIQP